MLLCLWFPHVFTHTSENCHLVICLALRGLLLGICPQARRHDYPVRWASYRCLFECLKWYRCFLFSYEFPHSQFVDSGWYLFLRCKCCAVSPGYTCSNVIKGVARSLFIYTSINCRRITCRVVPINSLQLTWCWYVCRLLPNFRMTSSSKSSPILWLFKVKWYMTFLYACDSIVSHWVFVTFWRSLIITPARLLLLAPVGFILVVCNLMYCRIDHLPRFHTHRALKTKGNTPKYGLIFHSTYIGRAGSKNKGRVSRYLANKCSIASRIDCFSGEFRGGGARQYAPGAI